MRAWANLRVGTLGTAERAPLAATAVLLQAWPTVIGESVTELWTSSAKEDQALVAGKVQNLRVATARLHGLHVVNGATFSFWQTLGKPNRRKGFVLGRELREGCLVASVGGGLCQLSNALYCAALDGGLQIVERHAHSQIVPGSRAELGRDATVYWNYVDLRFRHSEDFVIVATLTHDALKVQIRTQAQSGQQTAPPPRSMGRNKSIAIRSGDSPHDCVACEQTQCVEKIEPSQAAWQTAFLLDEVWPEYDKWVAARTTPGDVVLVPLDGALRQRKNYHWTCLQTQTLHRVEHRWLTLYRSLASRLLPPQGGVRQRKLLAMNAAFAVAYARQIPGKARHIVVPITLLADICRLGVLGGRTYDVLMTRAPLQMLHDSLDQAAALHPQSTTLADFRAGSELVSMENTALCGARTVITPHHAVADYVETHYGVAVEQLKWECKTHSEPATGSSTTIATTATAPWTAAISMVPTAANVLFPASALGRKGAYEVREACRQLGLSVHVLGSAHEESGFWQTVQASPASSGKLFHDVACVVLPAYVEHRPSILLRALAHGIPVVCSTQCGLAPGMPNVLTVDVGSVSALVDAIQKVLKPSVPRAQPV